MGQMEQNFSFRQGQYQPVQVTVSGIVPGSVSASSFLMGDLDAGDIVVKKTYADLDITLTPSGLGGTVATFAFASADTKTVSGIFDYEWWFTDTGSQACPVAGGTVTIEPSLVEVTP
jgi:hypothetical protein